MMTFQFILRTLYLLVVGVLLATLWFFRDIWMLVFLAIIIAVWISIPVDYLQRVRVPRAVAVTVSVLGTVVVALNIGFWLVPSVASDLGELFDRLPEFTDRLTLIYANWRAGSEWLSAILPPLAFGTEGGVSTGDWLQQFLGGSTGWGLSDLISGGNVVASFLTNLLLVVLMAIFFLVEPKVYVRASLYLLPAEHHARVLSLWSVLYHTLRTWLSTLSISIAITAALVWLILGALGMPNVLVVAAFAGIATFVPNIGALLPLIPISVFTLVSNPGQLPLMVGVYLGIQLVESNILTPSIVRRQLNIPLSAMLGFQVLAAFIFGLVGVLLAVPLLAVLIALVRELYSYGFLGLRGRKLQVALPEPAPHARDTRLPRRVGALGRRLRGNRVFVAREAAESNDEEM